MKNENSHDILDHHSYITEVLEKYLAYKRRKLVPQLIDPHSDPPTDQNWIDCLKLHKLLILIHTYPHICPFIIEQIAERLSEIDSLGYMCNNLAYDLGSEFFYSPYMHPDEYVSYIQSAMAYDQIVPTKEVFNDSSQILQFPHE